MQRMKHFVILCLAVSLFLTIPAAAGDVLSSLDKGHPRLMLKDQDLGRLKASYDEDAALQKCWQDARADAEQCLTKGPLVYKKVGPRLLSVSRDCLHRIYALTLIAGRAKYATPPWPRGTC